MKRRAWAGADRSRRSPAREPSGRTESVRRSRSGAVGSGCSRAVLPHAVNARAQFVFTGARERVRLVFVVAAVAGVAGIGFAGLCFYGAAESHRGGLGGGFEVADGLW